MLIAIPAALGAGGSFAAGGVLQQRAASKRPEQEALSFRLLLDLAHDPMWLLGIGFAFFSYALEGVALSLGPLVLVQPLIVTELLFALPISVRWRGMHMTWREWLGTAAVGAGLTVGLLSAAPGAGKAEAAVDAWAVGLSVVAGLTLLAVLLGSRSRGPLRSSLFALAAALVFGGQAALFKATVARFERGVVPGFESWEVYAMSAAAIVGLLLVQSAYEAGPLATSMPVVDAVEPSVAIVFGIALFNEHIRGGWWLAGIATGIALLVSGIVLLDTSPVVQCLQDLEREQRRSGPGGRPGGRAGQSGQSGPVGEGRAGEGRAAKPA